MNVQVSYWSDYSQDQALGFSDPYRDETVFLQQDCCVVPGHTIIQHIRRHYSEAVMDYSLKFLPEINIWKLIPW